MVDLNEEHELVNISNCLHGVWDYGKSIIDGVICLDFRKCVVCGVREYKRQNEEWNARG